MTEWVQSIGTLWGRFLTFGPLDNVKLSTWIVIAVVLLLAIFMLWVANAEELRHFILVHGPDDQNIVVNVDEISSVRTPQKKTPQGHFPKGTQCIIAMSNGTFIFIQEVCQVVYDRIHESESK